MRLIANFSNALRKRFLKSAQVSPYLSQGLSYTDAMRSARGKPLGINSTSPIVNTLQSRAYMTDPMDLSYVQSNLSRMNRDAPIAVGEVSTIANRLDNNRQVSATVKDAKNNWISQKGLNLSDIGLAYKGSGKDLSSQMLLPPERPSDRIAVGGVTAHTHPMMDTHAPSISDINATGNDRLGRNIPSSVLKGMLRREIPVSMQTIGKYDPYYAVNAPLDNFIYHQKSPTRSAVVHYPESDVLYNNMGLALKKSSDREVHNNIINKTIQDYTHTTPNSLSDDALRNLGLRREDMPSFGNVKKMGYPPEEFILSNLGKDNTLIKDYKEHPDLRQAFMTTPKMREVYTNLNSGVIPNIDQLKTKAYKSDQTTMLNASHNIASDLGIPYTQLGTVNKLTGKKR